MKRGLSMFGKKKNKNFFKILAVSDNEILEKFSIEQLKNMFHDIDFIMSAGDVSNHYLDFLVTALNKDLIYVNGNHVYGTNHDISFCKNIDGKVIDYKGLKIFGLDGSQKYSRGLHQYSEQEMNSKIMKNIFYLGFGHLDIILSHSPPRHIHDKDDFTHRGFEVFHKIIKNFKPKLWLHGHVHLNNHHENVETTVENTRIVNVYVYKVIEYQKK